MKNPDKTLKRFLISYGLLFLTLLVIMTASFFFAYVQFRNEIIMSKRAQLEYIDNRLQVRLDEIEKIGTVLTQQQDVLLRSLSLGVEYDRMNDLTDLQDMLISYKVVNSLIHTIYIYFYETDLVIFPDNISTRFGLTYGGYFSFGGYERDKWKELMLGLDGRRGILDRKVIYMDREALPSQNLLMYRKFPLIETGNGKGVVGILLSEEELTELVGIRDQAGSTAVYGGGGDLLLKTGPGEFPDPSLFFGERDETVYREGRSFFLYRYMERWDLHLFSGFSQKDILHELTPFLRVYFLIFVVYILIGLGGSFLFAKRNAVPFYRLQEENRTLADRIREYQPVLYSFFIHDIIQSGGSGTADIDRKTRELSLPVENGPCRLLIFEIGRQLENATSALIMDELSRLWEGRLLISYESPGRLIALIPESSELKGNMAALMESLKEYLPDNPIRAAVGRAMENFGAVSVCYERTAEILEYYPRNNLLYYENEISRVNKGYKLPSGYEKKIIQQILQGDYPSVKNLWKEIYDASFRSGTLGLEEVKEIRRDLEGVLVRLQTRLSYEKGLDIDRIRNEIAEILEEKKLTPRFDRETAFFSYLCREINAGKKSHNSLLKERIFLYLECHFREWDLGLDSLAGETGLSKNYLSNFFKEQFGETFMSCLTRLRTEEAIVLLKSGESPQSVAARVGYNSYNSFYRAFKRETGRNPTSFQGD